MDKLSIQKRAQIIDLLVDGNSMRALIAAADTTSQNQQVTNLQNGCCTNVASLPRHQSTKHIKLCV